MNIFYNDLGTIVSWSGKSPAPDGLRTLVVDVDALDMRMLERGGYLVFDGRLMQANVDMLTEAVHARMKRDALLASSDYTQLADARTAQPQAWIAYREALRDIPDQPGFPFEITWPDKPE